MDFCKHFLRTVLRFSKKLVENCEVKAKYIRSRKKEINAYCFEHRQDFVIIHPHIGNWKTGKIIKEIGTFKPRKEEIT